MSRVRSPFLAPILAALVSIAGSADADAAETPPASGDFTLLTYNVAGLPILISESEPEANIPLISGLLNLYDVAVVQEDFAYHGALVANATHAFRSEPLRPNEKVGIGDGLNLFSRFSFSRFERVTWNACNGRFSDGSDCLAPKGFTVATQEIEKDVELDLYDVHMDSGDARADVEARALQAAQLLGFMARRSAHRAVIVAGDTNMGRDSEDVLRDFLKRSELTDACRALGCKEPHRIDRVMYRGSRDLDLRVEELVVDDRFVRPDGKDLSDHKAVGVVFHWAKTGGSLKTSRPSESTRPRASNRTRG